MSSAPTESAHDPDPKGVGGWLAFLVLVLTVFSPLTTVSMTFAEHSKLESQYPELVNQHLWRTAMVLDWSMVALSAAISVVAGLILLKIFRRSTVFIVIGLIWLGAVGTAVLSLILSDYLMPGAASASNAGAALEKAKLWKASLLEWRKASGLEIPN